MPVKPEAPGDLLSLNVHLSSSRGAAIPAQALRQQFGNGIDRLLEIGAAHPGRPLSIVKCSACYEDHSAEVIYDAASRRSWLFCPDAGQVWVDDAELATLHLNTNWLPDRLARALDLAPTPPRLTVIKEAAWLLGDMAVGSTNVSVALAVGIMGAAEIDQLIEGLGRRKLLDLGLLLVGGSHLPPYVSAASKYAEVALDELASFENGSVCVERARLGAWIRGLQRGNGSPVGSGGRTSKQKQVLAVFDSRRSRGERYVSKQSEAKAIRSEWPAMYPDENPPGPSTVRGHLPDRVL